MVSDEEDAAAAEAHFLPPNPFCNQQPIKAANRSRHTSSAPEQEPSEDDHANFTICVEDDLDGITAVKDHFTLSNPSSTIRFRGNTTTSFRIYPSHNTQFVMESKQDEMGRHHVTMKRIPDVPANLRLLRLLYTLVTALFGGFVLVMCLEIVLILLTDFTIAAGFTSSQTLHVFEAGGVLLSFSVYIYTMAAALVMAGRKCDTPRVGCVI